MVEIRPDGPQPHAPVGTRVCGCQCCQSQSRVTATPLPGTGAAMGNAPTGWRQGPGQLGHPARQRRPALLFQQLRQHPDERELRSEEHTSELQSQSNLVCRLLLEKKKKKRPYNKRKVLI